MLSAATLPLLILILFAVAFDFINGFHDTANAVATVVSTRVLRPGIAIAMAGVLNFAGAMSGTEVAKTVGSGIVGSTVPLHAITAALVAAIAWNLLTWYRGIPSSSSHALVGSLLGAGIATLGMGAAHWGVLLH
jgi:PiT family inorganic phosphate transporter